MTIFLDGIAQQFSTKILNMWMTIFLDGIAQKLNTKILNMWISSWKTSHSIQQPMRPNIDDTLFYSFARHSDRLVVNASSEPCSLLRLLQNQLSYSHPFSRHGHEIVTGLGQNLRNYVYSPTRQSTRRQRRRNEAVDSIVLWSII